MCSLYVQCLLGGKIARGMRVHIAQSAGCMCRKRRTVIHSPADVFSVFQTLNCCFTYLLSDFIPPFIPWLGWKTQCFPVVHLSSHTATCQDDRTVPWAVVQQSDLNGEIITWQDIICLDYGTGWWDRTWPSWVIRESGLTIIELELECSVCVKETERHQWCFCIQW